MEIPRRWKLECPRLKRDAYLTFSIIETTILASSKKEGLIGRLKNCSLCAKAGIDICGDCPWASELMNQPVNLE